MQPTQSPWPFVASLALLALASAALVLLLPQLFGAGDDPAPWLLATLGGLALAGALGTRRFRPDHRS